MRAAELDRLPLLLSVAQAAAVLGINETTLRDWISDPAMAVPVRRDPGRHMKIAKPALLAWLERGAA